MIDHVSAVGGSSDLSTDDPTKEVVRMLLVLILMATGILLSHTAITSGGGTASIYGMYCVILWRGRTSYVPFPKIGSIGFI